MGEKLCIIKLHIFPPEIYGDIDYKHDINKEFDDDDGVVQALEVIEVHPLPGHVLVVKLQVKDRDERLKK